VHLRPAHICNATPTTTAKKMIPLIGTMAKRRPASSKPRAVADSNDPSAVHVPTNTMAVAIAIPSKPNARCEASRSCAASQACEKKNNVQTEKSTPCR